MNKLDAEEFTLSLGQIVAGSWRQIALAKRLGVPKALGLSVDDWVNQRLGGYVKMSTAEKVQALEELKAEGHSLRDIAEITGISKSQVHRDIVPNGTTDDENSNAVNDTSDDDVPNGTDAKPLDTITALAADESLHIEARKQQERETKRAATEQLKAQPAAIPTGKFSTVVIDPPWDMEKIERDVAPDQAGFDYPTMDEAELIAFGATIDQLAADDCHLLMWTTQKHLPSALTIIEQWGFRYVLTMVWHKAGGFQPFGLPQYNCEFVVYARRGSPKFTSLKAFNCCFEGPRREHSRKPSEFYRMIERVTPALRIDIFAREPREGFELFGNEVERFAEAL